MSLEMQHTISNYTSWHIAIWLLLTVFFFSVVVWVLVFRKPGPHKYEEQVLSREDAMLYLSNYLPVRVDGISASTVIYLSRKHKIRSEELPMETEALIIKAEKKVGRPCKYIGVIDGSAS